MKSHEFPLESVLRRARERQVENHLAPLLRRPPAKFVRMEVELYFMLIILPIVYGNEGMAGSTRFWPGKALGGLKSSRLRATLKIEVNLGHKSICVRIY